MDRVLLGKRIREERIKQNLTQEILAEDIDLTTAYVGQIERGERNVTLENLIKLANRLSVTVDYLLSDSISDNDDSTIIEITRLLNGRTLNEKELALNMVRSMLNFLDKDTEVRR